MLSTTIVMVSSSSSGGVIIGWNPRRGRVLRAIDAVRRDRALDTYERVQQRSVEELESRKTKENGQIQGEIDKYLTEQRAKMQSNSDEVAREKERFSGWRLKKQQEEKKIADAVGYFVSENPITTGAVSAQPPVSKTAQRS